jgi:uncharacterized protein with HEPN domain
MEAAEEFVGRWTFEEFAADLKTQFAVIRALELIGEAAEKIPFEVRDKYPSIHWKDLERMKEELIHRHFGVNLKAVWSSVKEGIFEAKPDIKHILDKMLLDEVRT